MGIKPLCTGPVYPFASLFFQSYDAALTVETFIAVSSINCWKSLSEIIGNLKPVIYQGKL